MGVGESLSITLRINEDTMNRFANAARVKHQDLTTFLLDAAERSVREINEIASERLQADVPAFFRGHCTDRSSRHGDGYQMAGRELTRQLERFEPLALGRDNWHAELERLSDLALPGEKTWGGWHRIVVHRRDDAAVLAWFGHFFPSCVALIPFSSREQFLAGVYQAFDDEVLGW